LVECPLENLLRLSKPKQAGISDMNQVVVPLI
jgi:hypothetical protein